ncbi:MAG: DNA repair protein RecN [Chloroflexota bacterium]
MLIELNIRDFAIIDELRVKFTPGLNLLTGETGAGKSIIVDALGAALGQRIDTDVVRTGANQALAEAVFQLDSLPQELESLLSEYGFEAEDGLLILSREVNRSSGRTVGRLNGRIVPMSTMQRVGQLLVDIHGQSEHLSLLRVKEHIDYLDRYAGLMDLRSQVSQAVRELRAVRNDIEQMTRDERESAREIDLLGYQIQEIRSANLSEVEEDQLTLERGRLRNAERLMEISATIHRLLSGGDEHQGAIDLLAQADRLFLELGRMDPSLEGDREALEAARFAVEDVAQKTSSYAEAIENDPQRLVELEERLDLISQLKRKYGRTVGEVLRYCEEAETRLEKLANRAYYLDELRQSENALLQKVGELAGKLSQARKEATVRLSEEMQRELADLNMRGTRFEVSFSLTPDPNGVPLSPARVDGEAGGREESTQHVGLRTQGSEPGIQDTTRVAFDLTGIDRVEFLVSPNPGEEAKPLARIASGGEMARLMLALKTILCQADAIPTLVFDEIDVGVGARSGMRVGEKLWRLTENHQVLCITHLPQIAAMADTHLSVAKIVEGGRTRTAVRQLEGEQRVDELATMLAGSAGSASAHASAKELLCRSEEIKGCKSKK